MKLFFSQQHQEIYFQLLKEVFDSGRWSEGEQLQRFEEEFEQFTGLKTAMVSSGGVALLALFNYADVKNKEVIVPANTFYATALAARQAGAKVVYADCERKDLCLSVATIKSKVTPQTKAVCVVHIGGHICFDIESIRDFCETNNLMLIEDCAHAHGASFKGKSAGSWGVGGAYSFYSTKTLPMGEGGAIVSKNQELIEWVKKFRNYGKSFEGSHTKYLDIQALGYRMNEFSAALGRVQLRNLPEILNWKRNLAHKYDQIFSERVHFPEHMVSGFYKYIVFQKNLKEKTGCVYQTTDQCHYIDGVNEFFPNTDWIGKNHQCAPIWYGYDSACLPVAELKNILLD